MHFIKELLHSLSNLSLLFNLFSYPRRFTHHGLGEPRVSCPM